MPMSEMNLEKINICAKSSVVRDDEVTAQTILDNNLIKFFFDFLFVKNYRFYQFAVNQVEKREKKWSVFFYPLVFR